MIRYNLSFLKFEKLDLKSKVTERDRETPILHMQITPQMAATTKPGLDPSQEPGVRPGRGPNTWPKYFLGTLAGTGLEVEQFWIELVQCGIPPLQVASEG